MRRFVAFLSLLPAALVATSCAESRDCTVDITNATSVDLHELYLVEDGDADWGPDLLDPDDLPGDDDDSAAGDDDDTPVPPGVLAYNGVYSATVPASPLAALDLHARDEDGSITFTRMDFETCVDGEYLWMTLVDADRD